MRKQLRQSTMRVLEATPRMERAQMRSLAFRSALEDGLVRQETLRGVEYTVVPVVAVVEGVLHAMNSESPELALGVEFGRFPEGWNGSPVLVGHPVNLEGEPVSASSPELWENSVIGLLFNTKLEDGKLKTEAWIDNEQAKKAGQQEILDILQSGTEVLEVSVGLFSQVEATSGKFRGASYKGIWRNIVPDHLAILPPGTIGACSVEDGCGTPRVNSSGEPPGNKPHMPYLINVSPHKRAATGGCGCGGCGEKCQCQTHGGTEMADETNAEPKAATAATGVEYKSREPSGLLARLMAAMGFGTGSGRVASEGMSSSDIAIALQKALIKKFGGRLYITAVYDKSVVYERFDEDTYMYTLYERDYTIAADGTVTFGEAVREVRPEISYVEVKVNEAAVEEQATGEIGETIVDASADIQQQEQTNQEAKPEEVKAASKNKQQSTTQEPNMADEKQVNLKTLSSAEVLEHLSDEAKAEILRWKEAHEATIKAAAEAKKKLVDAIRTNSTQFTEEELTSMDTPVLEKLAALAKVDYSVQGGDGTRALEGKQKPEENFVAPMPVFEPKDKAAA